MKVTVLGCGTSSGVPMVPNRWGACDPANPRNRRRRPSILVEQGDTKLVVDTGPDFREQMLAAGVEKLDAVLYTHDHADHTHGIDDLRGFFFQRGSRLPAYGDQATMDRLEMRFDYIFRSRQGYPPLCRAKTINGPFKVGNLKIIPFEQGHGEITSLGFRFGPFAYSTDVDLLPETAFDALAGIDTWIVDAVRYRPHPSHAHVDRALEWIDRIKPRQSYLTHMNLDLDYDELLARLPAGVEPAYDGLTLAFDA